MIAALIAAAVHDVDHPGMSNQFLVAIRYDQAIMYSDILLATPLMQVWRGLVIFYMQHFC